MPIETKFEGFYNASAFTNPFSKATEIKAWNRIVDLIEIDLNSL